MPNVQANGIQIEYDTFGEPTSPALLLIMGLSVQMIGWDEEFCSKLAGKGLFVIRFDNRDVGKSSKFESAGVPDAMAAMAALMRGEKISAPYTLDDMADDAVGLLTALGIEKAHICGLSMGSAIAQTIAIRHPSRALSLTLISGTTGNPTLPRPKPEAIGIFLTPPPRERGAFVDSFTQSAKTIAGSGFEFDEQWVRDLAARSYDRCFYPEGIARQLVAILAHGNRKPALAAVKIPTLVVHGKDDVLVPVECGIDTADAIPEAKLILIEGMGHDRTHGGAFPRIAEAIVEHVANASKG
jgi:pimeloyl-ACP methyl ester carboxylesterase